MAVAGCALSGALNAWKLRGSANWCTWPHVRRPRKLGTRSTEAGFVGDKPPPHLSAAAISMSCRSGGACGYTELAGTPYGLSVAAGSAIIFQNGEGCGQCYDVKCTHSSCKQEPTRVVITDSCPGGTYCSTGEPAFDLSGMAMTNMALPGRGQELRNVGLYSILYKRVPCYYPNHNIAFQVDPGSTPFWMSFTVKYQGGPGDIHSVEVRQAGRAEFQPMQHNWGANYMLICYSGQPFRGPYDVKITAKLNGHVLVAAHAIPEHFQPGALYESDVQLAY